MTEGLKSLPIEERPRERMLREGVDALSMSELIAIVLGSGMQGKSVLKLSQELLNRFDGLEGLLNASVIELMEIKGIGKAKAIQLKAVFAIILKARRPVNLHKYALQSPRQAFELAQAKIAHLPQESLLVMLCNIRGYLLHSEIIGMGTLSQLLIHPREIFYPAVRYKAHSMIIAHNHPSGDPTPSQADLELTRALIPASRALGIGINDHLIVCPD
jgi:DNA repair protein RadC